MGNKKKNNSPRVKAIKKMLIAPVSLLSFLILYPVFPLITKGVEGSNEYVANCKAIPLEETSLIIFTCYFIFIFALIPIVLRITISAIYLKVINSFAILLMGLWFLLIPYLILLCDPSSLGEKIFIPSIFALLLLTVGIFFLYQREKLKQVVKINPHVYDFETMQYSFLAPILRPDGKNTNKTHIYLILGASFGLLISRLEINDFFNLNSYAGENFIGIFSCWLVGYAFSGYLAIGNLYLAWLIHKNSKEVGRKMIVKELM